MVRILQLKNTEVLEVRLEDKAEVEELSGRRFSFITSRAFTEISRFLKLVSPYLEQNGRLVLMKGPGVVNELSDLGSKGLDGKFQVEDTRKIYLPFSNKERWLISIRRSDTMQP